MKKIKPKGEVSRVLVQLDTHMANTRDLPGFSLFHVIFCVCSFSRDLSVKLDNLSVCVCVCEVLMQPNFHPILILLQGFTLGLVRFRVFPLTPDCLFVRLALVALKEARSYN